LTSEGTVLYSFRVELRGFRDLFGKELSYLLMSWLTMVSVVSSINQSLHMCHDQDTSVFYQIALTHVNAVLSLSLLLWMIQLDMVMMFSNPCLYDLLVAHHCSNALILRRSYCICVYACNYISRPGK
jgi:hypothetical protein